MSIRILYLLCLLLAIAATMQSSVPQLQHNEGVITSTVDAADVPKVRAKRGLFWDFFQKMVTTKNLVVDQYLDTRDSLSEVYNLINEGFSDPAPRKATIRPPTSTAKSSDEDSSDEEATTTEGYALSRYELGRILGRNFRGLQRLTKIEFQDAFNQSRYNVDEYKAEARKQFANSLGVEKVNKIKDLKAAIVG